jgi:hypothetical protein
MYKEHEVFQLPHDRDTYIWRYMDLTKLVSILDSRALWFSRADHLGDPFEGYPPKSQFALSPQAWHEVEARIREGEDPHADDRRYLESFLRGEDMHGFLEFRKKVVSDPITRTIMQLRDAKEVRKESFVNCWHISKCETEAMWNQYQKSGSGIVIRSTVQRLIDSVRDYAYAIYIGCVKYIDH